MNQDTLISIIVPIYKVEKYLKKCIESILNQTYKNLQIILVDDGSPDNSGAICDEYAKLDNRIQVIHKPNGGLSDARNVGIKSVKGEYIGFVDSDDYIESTMFEDLLTIIKKEDADMAMCNFYDVVNGENKLRYKGDIDFEAYDRIEILKEIVVDRKVQSYAWNKLYKKDLFDDVEYPTGRNYEDIGTTFYILEKCNRVVYINKPEYYYLNRKDSIVNNPSQSTIVDKITIANERYDYIEQKYPELRKYNMYSITNILITTYQDLTLLDGIGEELKEKLDVFTKKVTRIINEHIEEYKDLLTEKQINLLKEIV